MRRLLCPLGLVASLTAGGAARAESANLCPPAAIVEVFVGTDTCPTADYLVLELVSQGTWGVSVQVLDECMNLKGYFGGVGPVGPKAQRFLVASPAAESLFGLKADITTTTALDLAGGETLVYECNSFTSVVPLGPFPAGKALKKTTNGWVFVDPVPVNGAGEIGTLGTCPPNARVPDAAGDASDPDADAGADAEAGPLNCTGGTGGVAGAASSGGGARATGGVGGTVEDAAADAAPDASASGASSGLTDGGPGTGASDDEASCGCRVLLPPAPFSGAALLVVAAAWVLRRRRSR